MRRDAFDEIVELIYRAVEEPRVWSEVMGALLGANVATSGLLGTHESGGAHAALLEAPGFSADALRLYGEYYHRVDPWVPIWTETPTMASSLGEEHVPMAVFEQSEIWRDFSRHHIGAYHVIGASFALADGRIGAVGFHRQRGAPPFDADSKRALDRLLPHLCGALRLGQRLGPAVGGSLGFAVLDALEMPVVVLRADGTTVFANEAAIESPTLRLGAGRRPVATADPADERPFLAAIRDAAGGGPGGALMLSAPGAAPVAALVTPLPPGMAETQGMRGLALVVLRAAEMPTPVVGRRLRQLFGLTAAEAELALSLLAGQRLEAIAEARAVRISTVRFQLRAVLEKTGTRRQSDLVRLLARLTPFRDDGAQLPDEAGTS